MTSRRKMTCAEGRTATGQGRDSFRSSRDVRLEKRDGAPLPRAPRRGTVRPTRKRRAWLRSKTAFDSSTPSTERGFAANPVAMRRRPVGDDEPGFRRRSRGASIMTNPGGRRS